MTGFFMCNNGNRLEVHFTQDIDGDEEVNEVMIELTSPDNPEEPWISIEDPEELEELISYLQECKEKLKFHNNA